MSATYKGIYDWSATRDDEGHREYRVIHQVNVSDMTTNYYGDGPAIVMACAGLPSIGSAWAFGNDSDAWAFCYPFMRIGRVRRVKRGEKPKTYLVEQRFGTKPLRRCQTSSIENPLNEPARIGGTFIKYTKPALLDYNGDPIKSSSHEPIPGAERDSNHPTVWVELNTLTNQLATFAPMIDTLNDATLWGLPSRTIKLSNVTWERKLYGTCTYYYTTKYEFEIHYSTWDDEFPDSGTKVLADGGDADNPEDFVIHKDESGSNSRVYLDGSGNAVTDPADIATITAEYYGESNLLTLGIPASL